MAHPNKKTTILGISLNDVKSLAENYENFFSDEEPKFKPFTQRRLNQMVAIIQQRLEDDDSLQDFIRHIFIETFVIGNHNIE